MTILTIIYLGIAAGFISLTITKSNFFESFRNFFFFRSEKNIIMRFLHELVTCPYCFSHWVTLTMVAVWQPRLTNCGWLLIDLGVSWFVLIGIASYAWGVFFKLTDE
jgi:hypothetical protein